MKENVIKVIRWLFFLPAAIVGTFLFDYFFGLVILGVFSDFPILLQLVLLQLFTTVGFLLVAAYVIPINGLAAIRTICVSWFILVVGIAIWGYYNGRYSVDNLIGLVIPAYIIGYALFNLKKFAEVIFENPKTET